MRLNLPRKGRLAATHSVIKTSRTWENNLNSIRIKMMMR